MKFKVYQDNGATPTLLVFGIILFWFIYACIYSILKNVPNTALLSGYLSLIGETGLDIFLAGLVFRLWSKTKGSRNGSLFLIFFSAIIASIFADGIYNIVLNLYEFQYVNPMVICMFELPFSLFLFFQAMAWTYILHINKENSLNFSSLLYIPYIVVSTLMFSMFMFGVKWQIQYFSLNGIFQSIDTILEVFGFSMATICLARAQTYLIRFTSIGYLLIVASDFIIRYHVISGIVPYLSSLESTWMLGLILMSLGFFLVKDSYDEKLFRLSAVNSLQSQIAIWLLVLWLISVFMFAGTYYFFSPSTEPYLTHITKNFLSMLVPFSVLAIISSSYISIKISSPLSKLESKINEFLLTEVTPEEITHLTDYDYISEFKALEKFIFDAFTMYQKKHITDMNFAKLAAQVTHDIRSPLAAINIAVLDVTTVPENRRIMIRNASKRINDIANNLLSRSKSIFSNASDEKLDGESDSDVMPELIFVVVDNIVSEKRYEYFKSKIDIQLQIAEDTYNCFSGINSASFNRVLSNLINNSVESLNEDGLVLVSIASKLSYIEISIEDNGCGIPIQIMSKVKEQGFSFNKKNGAGFGLFYANQYIEQINGKMLIESKENIGTKITIELKQTEQPNWFCHELHINPNSIIVVLDDDLSIHDAWDERFSNLSNINLKHFFNTSDLLEYTKNSLSQATYYLIDYELIANNMNGLDIIEELRINHNAILVTSCFEDALLRERCEKMVVKIIPKSYVPFIKIIQKPINEFDNRIVLIDDDEIMRTAWTLVAESTGKKISTYSSFERFTKEMNAYSKETTIYIDSELGNNIKGETCAKYLFDNGFTTIHLATGYSPDQFDYMPWLKSIIGKDPLLIL